MMNKKEITKRIKQLARDTGFHKVGIAPAQRPPHSDFLREWLMQGRHGEMHWMERYLEKRLNVQTLYPQARSVIVVAHNYFTDHSHAQNVAYGKISRYAWGNDYHKIIKKKLKHFLNDIRKKVDPSIEGRLFVDSAPVQEKLFAQAAGIGWQGKNTNIISREMGSWFFLGELIINRELVYDEAAPDYCGSCTACIEACPTQALQPYHIDARKCISYLTIELWDKPIPDELAGRLNNWIFGCDICQDVCPWNRFAKESDEAGYQPAEGNVKPLLEELLHLTPEDFKQRFKKSPVYRAKYENFMRNVRAVAENSGKEHLSNVPTGTSK